MPSLGRKLALYLGIIASLLILVGCSAKSTTNANPSSACQLMLLQEKLVKDLTSDGIQVVQQGDETTLLLPSDSFFYTYSNNRLASSDKKLNKIIEFLNTYGTVDILVTGYTDNVGDSIRNLALSRSQAQAIVNYLWANGLDSRLISAQGKGCADDIADNSTYLGRKANRRIEITFRLPPPDNVFN